MDEATNSIIDSFLWELEFPGQKHYGGALAFGPDRYLYAGIDDGGWVHGPHGDDSPLDRNIIAFVCPHLTYLDGRKHGQFEITLAT